MTNLLSLKAVVWTDKGFTSPSHREFTWPTGVVEALCPKCQGAFDPNCTCGIYSSPNPEALEEYSHARTSIFVLLNLYGWTDIWPGPSDLAWTYPIRSHKVKIVGIVDPSTYIDFNANRQLASIHGAEFYNVKIYPFPMIKRMIKITWEHWTKIVKNPYKREPR